MNESEISIWFLYKLDNYLIRSCVLFGVKILNKFSLIEHRAIILAHHVRTKKPYQTFLYGWNTINEKVGIHHTKITRMIKFATQQDKILYCHFIEFLSFFFY